GGAAVLLNRAVAAVRGCPRRHRPGLARAVRPGLTGLGHPSADRGGRPARRQALVARLPPPTLPRPVPGGRRDQTSQRPVGPRHPPWAAAPGAGPVTGRSDRPESVSRQATPGRQGCATRSRGTSLGPLHLVVTLV